MLVPDLPVFDVVGMGLGYISSFPLETDVGPVSTALLVAAV
ncbi:hypothetical protein AGR2A_pa60157 [Agrobacterium genomosp. 2 str. CFBP 5494]|uniref:Uncharacterized protein n=1 Tax=Agrobacterium genomosp. 2 str. CFBP 5494 TaxID=1183436 RepID=A0A9W5B7S1_9HYPH|nr:hypothetical protein AGR2A_pa60157 [Agrobacterium genomosp. 2 str. CFBP 5494]